LEEEDENRMPKMRKGIAKVSNPKKNEWAIKATGDRNQNFRISKKKKSCKRKVEAARVTEADAPNGENHII
jgi:hypothetical protein